jgi:hypothetical protein
MFLERANADDVDGVVALYEPNAVLAFPPSELAASPEQIRAVYVWLLATWPALVGTIRPARPQRRSGDHLDGSTRQRDRRSCS